MFLIYNFCRQVDDIADSGLPPERKRTDLQQWRKDIDAVDNNTLSQLTGATLTIDTTGPGLHKRGYRQLVAEAPLRETLAAAILQFMNLYSETGKLSPVIGAWLMLDCPLTITPSSATAPSSGARRNASSVTLRPNRLTAVRACSNSRAFGQRPMRSRNVAEFAGSNLFIAKDGAVATPARRSAPQTAIVTVS